jgi:hypothetical protein
MKLCYFIIYILALNTGCEHSNFTEFFTKLEKLIIINNQDNDLEVKFFQILLSEFLHLNLETII